MSVANIPITVDKDYQIGQNDSKQICVGTAGGTPVCYPVLLPHNQLIAKYSVLSYMIVMGLVKWSTLYTMTNNGIPTPAQLKQVFDIIFSQLPWDKLRPFEDNGKSWTVDVLNNAVSKVVAKFSMTPADFTLNVQPNINKYLGDSGGGGHNNQWMGAPMWVWYTLLVLLVLLIGMKLLKKKSPSFQ